MRTTETDEGAWVEKGHLSSLEEQSDNAWSRLQTKRKNRRKNAAVMDWEEGKAQRETSEPLPRRREGNSKGKTRHILTGNRRNC